MTPRSQRYFPYTTLWYRSEKVEAPVATQKVGEVTPAAVDAGATPERLMRR
jgi:hypothetical protein